MKLSIKSIGFFGLIVLIAYAPTFALAGSIDGDEWLKSGAGAIGIALVGIAAKMFAK